MRLHTFILFFCLLFLSSCASLRFPDTGAYPYRAQFEGSAFVKGDAVDFEGALSIVARDKAFGQIYGPIGLVLYTLDISGGQAKIYNIWGRLVKSYPFKEEQVLMLVAGIPPDSRYLWKKTLENGGTSVTYVWGNLVLDEDNLPREVHVRSDPVVDAFFTRQGRTITLMMTRGSDKLEMRMNVVEGGRWLTGNAKGGM